MSMCSAAEVAEKRRIALEKLAAKKQRLAQTANSTSRILEPQQQGATAGLSSLTNNFSNINNNKQPTFLKPATGATSSLNDVKHRNVVGQSNSARNPGGSVDSRSPFGNRISFDNGTYFGSKLQKPHQSLAPVFACICKVYMVSATRFAVQPSSFHAKLIDVFKTIPTKAYDSNTRIWTFALQDYELLQQRVSGMRPDIVMGAIPKSVIKLCRMPPVELDHNCLSSIEPILAGKLLPFQQEGVCFAIAQRGRLMICDEMGLGKTYQALAVADYFRESWPLLICTTASVRESWATHIRELLPHVPLHYVQTLTNNQQYVGDAKILITSYNLMDRHESTLMAIKFGFVIFDESHSLKNSKSKCAAVAERFARQAQHVILLSGTPALSRPLELFTQLHMIDRTFMPFVEFTSRYCDAKQTRFGWDATGQSNLEELKVILERKFMVRRTKDAVLPQLAEKTRETVILDPALIWTNDSKDSLENFTKDFSSSKGREREEILLKFYARTAEVKAHAVCQYLKKLIKEIKKFIVFAHHRVLLDAITECFKKSDVNFIRIDGSTKNEIRAQYIEIFQNKASCQVALLSLRACNAGITLTSAEMIIFAELDWNPSTLAQAESRAHRIGQQKPIICRYLMASKTADDIIWNMLKSKQDVLNRAGLFCDDLQDATHTIGPTSSHSIEKYFSPIKKDAVQCNVQCAMQAESPKSVNRTPNPPSTPSTAETSCADVNKDLENIEDFFQDDDAFKDLIY